MGEKERDERFEGDAPDEREDPPIGDIDSLEVEEPESDDAAEAAENDAGDEDEDVDALKVELEVAREEAAGAREQALRMAAEAQNVRHRAEKDVEKARKFGLERFAGDLLPIVDNLERAMDAARGEGDDIKAIVEGIELTHRSFMDVLAKHNIEAVNPVGEPFDPQFHEAMSMVSNPDVEPNTVVDVMQKGYTLNGRLLRAAMVVVAKGGGK